MDKMLVDSIGDITITNDGATLPKNISICGSGPRDPITIKSIL